MVRIAPFSGETDSLNPLELITNGDTARIAAELLIPKEATPGTPAEFFETLARDFLTGALLFFAQFMQVPPEDAGTEQDPRSLSALR